MSDDQKDKKSSKEDKKNNPIKPPKLPPVGDSVKPYMMWIIILISVFTLFYLSKQSEKIKK